MKNSNFITVTGWMVNILKLSGNDLIVYALIFGFSQDGESEYKGNIDYISNSINCSTKTAGRVLCRLTDGELILKTSDNTSGIIQNKYKINPVKIHEDKKSFSGDSLSNNRDKKSPETPDKKSLNKNSLNNTKENNIDFPALLKIIVEETGVKYRVITEKSKKNYLNVLKSGLKKIDIVNAIKNAVLDDYHIETKYKYLTPEFFSRIDKINSFAFRDTYKTKKKPLTATQKKQGGGFTNF